MARIRTIKPEFWTSEQVMNCSPMARLLFIGIWNFCDDAGNHVASAKTIKANVYPGDDITSTDVQRLLDELSSNSLIVFYSHENKQYLHVTGWHHQKVDKPTYKHPPYKPGENGEESEPPRRVLDESSPPEGKGNGRERKGKEEETTTTPPPESREAPPPSSSPPPGKIPDEAPSRAVQLAVILRRGGACPNTHATSRGIADLVELNATDAEALTALETAKRQRQAAGSAQAITVAYLVPIVRELRAAPPDKPKTAAQRRSAWSAELADVIAKADPRQPREIDMGVIDATDLDQ